MVYINENPKILLVNPPSLRLVSLKDIYTTPFPYIPYGPLHVATYLDENGYKTKVFNADFNIKRKIDRNEDEIWWELKNAIRLFKPDVLGVSIRSLQYKSAIKTAEIAKNLNEDIVVIAGGWHPTFMYDEVANSEFIDFVVIREGEITTLELINALIKDGSIKEIEGIAYEKDGKVIKNPERKLIQNLDDLPFPNRELLIKKKYYPYVEISSITPSRGCPYKCTFCPSYNFWGYRSRSPNNIVNEIEFLHDKYKMEEFWFFGESFFTSEKRLMEFYDEIKNRGLDIIWGSMARVDEINNDTIKKLKSIGLYNVSLGAESGCQDILDITNKNITIEQIKKAVKILKENDIFVYTYWMIGYIEETMDSIKATEKLINEIDTDDLDVVFMTPYPGTVEYEKAKKANRLNTTDWSEYYPRNPKILKRPHIDDEELYSIYKEIFIELEYKKSQKWMSFLVRNPKIFIKKLKSIIIYELASKWK